MSEPEGLDRQLDGILLQQQDATMHALLDNPGAGAVLGLIRQVHHDMSATIEALPSKTQHACAAGCAFCCYLPVDVLAPEAFLIASHLQQTRSAGELTELLCRLAACRQPGPGTHPCVFLAHGRCSIYEVRPMVCRGYNSLSKERCEAYFHDVTVDLKGTKDRLAGRLAEAMEDGVVAGLMALGLDAQWYELPGAVLRALEVPDGPERWARGEEVFQGCDQLSQWQC